MELFTLQALWAFLAIVLIDIVLAGDNALVIGMAANKLPPELRKKAIFWGTFGAIVVADAVMGIDNALGIAAAANGSFILVIAGLLISVPIILFGAGLVSKILEKYPDTVFIGSFVLFAVAMLMLMKEPLMANWWAGLVPWAAAIVPWAVALVITAVQYNKARLHLHKKFLFKQDHQA